MQKQCVRGKITPEVTGLLVGTQVANVLASGVQATRVAAALPRTARSAVKQTTVASVYSDIMLKRESNDGKQTEMPPRAAFPHLADHL